MKIYKKNRVFASSNTPCMIKMSIDDIDSVDVNEIINIDADSYGGGIVDIGGNFKFQVTITECNRKPCNIKTVLTADTMSLWFDYDSVDDPSDFDFVYSLDNWQWMDELYRFMDIGYINGDATIFSDFNGNFSKSEILCDGGTKIFGRINDKSAIQQIRDML